jgi:hypothetical protein
MTISTALPESVKTALFNKLLHVSTSPKLLDLYGLQSSQVLDVCHALHNPANILVIPSVYGELIISELADILSDNVFCWGGQNTQNTPDTIKDILHVIKVLDKQTSMRSLFNHQPAD